MGKPRVGSAWRHGDHWDIQATKPDGKRTPPQCLPPSIQDEDEARALALSLTKLAARGELAAPVVQRRRKGSTTAPSDTLSVWSEKWCDVREEHGLTSVKDDRGRLRKWVEPKLGDKPMAEITRRDLEAFVEYLDDAVRAEELSWKTAKNVWGVVSKMFDDAHRSKTLALRVLTDNPCAGVRGPDEGVKKSKSYVYPSEFVRLVECPRVPIRWRRLVALAIYTYTRAGELEALEKEDVDLDAMVIHVHRAIDRSTEGEVKETKTNNPRRIPIEPNLAPLVRVLMKGPGPRLVDMPPACDLSPRLRQYLEWAGVTRAELFAGDKTRKAITWHDLRSSGITWMAIRGDEPMKIMRRAGHENMATTMGYVREAENLLTSVGEPFPPLPESLLESLGESLEGPARWAQLRGTVWKTEASPAGFDRKGTRAPPEICGFA